jgi:L-seryl-tRNA(Ser) seleniumtransferase
MAELRDLPGVDALLSSPELTDLIETFGLETVKASVREVQSEIRSAGSAPEWAITPAGYSQALEARLQTSAYKPVFNLTGTIIHTNLGRALLSADLWDSIRPLVTRPFNLEYDVAAGRRGDRDLVIESRLQRLMGCEAATVVNNNAAALMLVLNTFALGKSVPVSRGELIEIGGSFRLPELMTRAGCMLTEVGTTNRTHLEDFERVATDAAMLLKVHPSNYHIDGFSAEVSADALAELARDHDIPSCVDLGSGTLVDLTQWGLPREPTPQAVLDDGIDLVTFSGDKLLGGVQAGIIVGKRTLLDEIKKNPMKRALRADKITLALLDATLKLYEDPETLVQALPLLRTLTLDTAALKARARKVKKAIPTEWDCAIVETDAQIGSGALPANTIPSIAVTMTHPTLGAEATADLLRALPIPIVARIRDDKVWLDMHGADPMRELTAALGDLRA